MTPLRQVVHVLWKDLREHRVRLAIFAGLVTIALARALGAPIPVASGVLALMIVLGAIAIVGAPVESDPPADSRSSWASRPLAPGAVLAAKLGFAALLLLLVALAQAIGLWSLDLRTADAIRYVTGPAHYFALVLLATLVVAGASGESRTRLLLIFALLLAFLAALARLAKADPVTAGFKGAATVVSALLMLGALHFFYHSRSRGRIASLVALVVLSLGAVAVTSRTVPAAMPLVASGVPRAEIRVSLPPEAPVVQRGHVRVRISAVQPAPGWQYSIREPRLEVILASGHVIRLDGDHALMNLGGDPGTLGFPASESIRAMQEPARYRELSIPVGQGLATTEGDSIQQVTLSGPVLVSVLRAMDTIPLVVGASHARLGVRSIIDSVITTPGGPEIVLRAEGLMKPEDQSRLFPFTSYFGRAYVLVGAHGERVPMAQTWTASGSGGLVLLSDAFGDARLRLAPLVSPSASGRPADAEWMRNARLVAIEPRTQGQYPVTVSWTRPRAR